jgi:xylan 1,4-beta-xylosidase
MRLSVLKAFYVAAFACAVASTARGEVSAASTYANPLPFSYESNGALRREVRDPCVIHEGDTYFLTFTMWPFANREQNRMGQPDNGSSPGIALYSSLDLKEWKFENWLVKSSELPVNCPYKHRFWAPEIHKINGKFYLIFTADNWLEAEYNPAGNWGSAGYAFVGVADAITGPYRHITYIPGGACDTTLFVDTDGQIYAVMPKYNLYVRRIDLSRLETSEIRWIGEESKILDCKNDDIGLQTSPEYLEGPWMERIGERYYLFYAELYKDKNYPHFEGYKTGVAYANSPFGPWKKDARGQIFYGGHLAVFDGPEGAKWFSYRIEDQANTRGLLAIDPLAFDEAGILRETVPTRGQEPATIVK